jgi:SAM-dependent methyltransferase
MEKLLPLAGKRVLDLGCGEGYVSRQIKDAGAASVLGIDISAGMVEAAQAEEARSPRGIVYEQGDAATLDDLPEGAYDRVAAVFLFNYVDSQVMTEVMRRVRHWLAPGGRFVFTIPHPSLPFIRAEEPPFFFQRPETGYFSTKDMTLEGSIWGRDGHAVPVRCVHKPLEVYFQAMRNAGWTCLPDLVELRVRPEDIELDPEFFGPLIEEPLHILFSLER